MGKMFFNRFVSPRFLGQPGDEALATDAEARQLPPILDYLERTIPDEGYLVDGRLTLADLAVASPFVNWDPIGVRPDPARYPKTCAYVARILARPSFAPLIEQERAFAAATATAA